jgi:transcriptional regulator with XRE-family HTH domain
LPSDSIHILPVLDLETVPVPPRSRLFSVQPIGAGTSNVEAVTSLLTEIANRHHVRADRLVELLGDTAALRTTTEARRQLRSLHLETPLNGCGSRAARFVAGVEELTGLSRLASHTMLMWARTLPTHGLIRPFTAWCAACLADDREASGRPYLRLLWQLQPVQVCVDHRCFLSDACPRCARRVPPFPAACLAGHCPHCGSRLADDPIRFPARREEGWLNWAAAECGSLLQVSSPDHPAVQVGASARGLQAAIDQVANGRLVVFAERLGLARGKVSEWRAGLVAPALPSLLRLCYALDVRIVDFLSGDFRAVLRFRRTQRLAPRSDYRKWTPRVLEAALRGELTQPRPTLTAVERRLGCDRKTLRRHQPELCDQVVIAGQERRAALEMEKIGRLAAEVETAVQRLVAAGVLPTAKRVSALLARPGALRHPEARRALRAAAERAAPVQP